MDNAGALMVITLVGLVFPIALLLLAVLFDVLVVFWAAYRVWHEHLPTNLWQVLHNAHVPRWHFVRSR